MGRILRPLRLAAVAVIAVGALGVGITQAAGGDSPRAERNQHSEFPPFNGQGESTHCPRGRAKLERNKRNVVGYYTTAFNDKEPEEAVRLYGGAEYIQHNPLAANGFQAFIDFVNFFAAQNPDLHIDIRRVFAECDFVITQSLLTVELGELGNKVVDIFRVDRDGKIVEHWDVLSPLSPTSANGNPEV